MNRFVAKVLPTINITKWYDRKNKNYFYDLYINGKYDSRYLHTETLNNRILFMMNSEVVENVDK